MNTVTLIGNLGKDPETKQLSTGQSLTTFSLATTHKYKDQKHTEWHTVKIFGKLADVASQYLNKGDKVAVVGRIHYNNWEDQEGARRSTTEILVTEMEMLSGKKKAAAQAPAPPADHSQEDGLPWEQ